MSCLIASHAAVAISVLASQKALVDAPLFLKPNKHYNNKYDKVNSRLLNESIFEEYVEKNHDAKFTSNNRNATTSKMGNR